MSANRFPQALQEWGFNEEKFVYYFDFKTSSSAVYLRVRMGLNVRSQVAFVGKRLLASRVAALERPLSRVRADVTLKQPRTREGLSTVRTLAVLVVRAHVHAERRHRDINFITYRTPACLFVLQRAMCLSVSCQIGT